MEKRNNSEDALSGIFYLKENNAMTMGQFQSIFLMSKERSSASFNQSS